MNVAKNYELMIELLDKKYVKWIHVRITTIHYVNESNDYHVLLPINVFSTLYIHKILLYIYFVKCLSNLINSWRGFTSQILIRMSLYLSICCILYLYRFFMIIKFFAIHVLLKAFLKFTMDSSFINVYVFYWLIIPYIHVQSFLISSFYDIFISLVYTCILNILVYIVRWCT